MRKFKIVSRNGCINELIVEVSDNSTECEIAEAVGDVVLEHIEYDYEEVVEGE